jgi:hypothetical protein
MAETIQQQTWKTVLSEPDKYVKEHLPQGPVNINTSADIFFSLISLSGCIFIDKK